MQMKSLAQFLSFALVVSGANVQAAQTQKPKPAVNALGLTNKQTALGGVAVVATIWGGYKYLRKARPVDVLDEPGSFDVSTDAEKKESDSKRGAAKATVDLGPSAMDLRAAFGSLDFTNPQILGQARDSVTQLMARQCDAAKQTQAAVEQAAKEDARKKIEADIEALVEKSQQVKDARLRRQTTERHLAALTGKPAAVKP